MSHPVAVPEFAGCDGVSQAVDRQLSGPASRIPSLAAPNDEAPIVRTNYESSSFVARYAAVWAYGVADPDRMSEPYYQQLLSVAVPSGRPPVANVLDMGCGPGRILADLADELPGARCTGVDASPLMVALARKILHAPAGGSVPVDAGDYGFPPAAIPARGRPDVQVLHRTLDEHAREARRYDLVVASHLLDRVPNPIAALDSFRRLVMPGGRLVLSCAFNYERRHQWSIASGPELAEQVARRGFEIEHLNDDVEYAERLDIRGTVTQHRVAVLRARAAASS